MAERDLDVVLLGATGFTGTLTAEYLARRAPAGLRWALAGRDTGRLAELRARLAETSPAAAEVELVHADVTDSGSLADLAARTRVVATTVGPYLVHGEPLVAACAEAGTDYVDLTGEPEFVDRMYLAHHATAAATGARIVHACGFDSIPYDLGVYFTMGQLGPTGPVRVRGVVRAHGGPSGGTYHSALTQMSRVRQMREAAAARRRVEGRPEGRSSRAVPGRPHRDPVLGYWLLPLPTIDPIVVARSGRALASYGPDFRYSHYAGTKTLRYAVGGAAGGIALALGAQVGPARERLLRRIEPGEGPSPRRRARSWFTVDIIAEEVAQEVAEEVDQEVAGGGSEAATRGGGRMLHTRVSGGDPGYDETAKMLAESAMCLALDDNPPTAGCVTTAEAMGDRLLARLQDAGLRFEVVG